MSTHTGCVPVTAHKPSASSQHLLLGRKVMTSLDSIFKSRNITLSSHLVKALVFPVVMYGCESWTVKKAECRRIDAFELWCCRRLLRATWTARRSNQSILKRISPEYSLEGLMLKLNLQYFGHMMWRTDSLEKTLMLGKIEGKKRKGQQRMRWLAGITDSVDEFEEAPGVDDEQGSLACCSSWVAKCWTQLSNWTELNRTELYKQYEILFSLWKAFPHKKNQRAQERASEDLYSFCPF